MLGGTANAVRTTQTSGTIPDTFTSQITTCLSRCLQRAMRGKRRKRAWNATLRLRQRPWSLTAAASSTLRSPVCGESVTARVLTWRPRISFTKVSCLLFWGALTTRASVQAVLFRSERMWTLSSGKSHANILPDYYQCHSDRLVLLVVTVPTWHYPPWSGTSFIKLRY